MHYRRRGRGPAPPPGTTRAEANRAALQALVDSGRPPGLVAYRDGVPVGWVSVGPREEYLRLERSPVMKPVDERPVWSIVCFVVPSGHRRQGVARALLEGAVAYAKRRGATLIEAYPVDEPGRSRDDALWFGTKSMYDRAGFREVARRKPRRPMVRLALALALALSAAGAARADPSAGDRILGEWRGTSVCTNLELAPACKDETVRYVFTRKAGSVDLYHVVADKLVAGAFETMGEFDLEYSDADGTWFHELDAPRCPKCRWWFRIEPDELVGGAATASGQAIRKVVARRPGS
jgi:GNAT superfamily N-acetyltransferase